MNFISLYYFKELTQDLNMTQTARRLFISQQTLSNHILRLEHYYKIPLFTRQHGLKLTPAGKQLLEFATKVLNEHKQLQDLFIDMQQEKRGFLRFGASRLRSAKSLPHVLPQFSEQYPHVEIQLVNDNSETLQTKLKEGELDLALCILNESPQSGFEVTRVLRDQVFLCVPEGLLNNYYPKQASQLKDKSLAGARLADFSKLPFVLPTSANKLGKSVAACFEEAGYTPQVYLSSKYIVIESTVAEHNLAAFFMTQTSVFSTDSDVRETLNIFPLLHNGNFLYLDLYLMRPIGAYQSTYTRYFSQLLEQHFAEINAARIIHKVESVSTT